jgi:hypothetical protein
MATHNKPAARWWDRYDYLMWAVSRCAEHWQLALGIPLFTIFAVVPL